MKKEAAAVARNQPRDEGRAVASGESGLRQRPNRVRGAGCSVPRPASGPRRLEAADHLGQHPAAPPPPRSGLASRQARPALARTLPGFGFYFLTILAVVSWLTTIETWAHRDRGPDDPCRRQIGDSLLHLTLYQPQFDPAGEYCEEVPRAGKTIVVVDFTAGELRQTPMSVEVIQTALSGKSQTVLSLPAKTYALGVADSEALLSEGNDYLVRVLLDMGGRDKSDVLVFPIRVAAWYRAMLMPALLVAGLLVLIAISVIRYYAGARTDESLAGWASRQSNRVA
jgi:hypothetical protein